MISLIMVLLIIVIGYVILRIYAPIWSDGREKRSDEQYQWKTLILISWFFNLKDKFIRWNDRRHHNRINKG